MELPFADVALVLKNFAAIAVAFVLALPIGWEREQSERSAGLRTFPLVAMASCGYILLASRVLGEHPEGLARVLEGGRLRALRDRDRALGRQLRRAALAHAAQAGRLGARGEDVARARDSLAS